MSQSIPHGGNLDAQIAKYGGTRADWLDLSTGINPIGYPVDALAAEIWQRLPEREDEARLLETAVRYYAAPSKHNISAVPGTQALIQQLPRTLPYLMVRVLSPTYGEHAPSWEKEGFKVEEVSEIEAFDPAGINVVVNPNNPDGTLYKRTQLENLAVDATKAGGWLIVDEAFGDLVPEESVAPLCANQNVIVLKSIGKFFGLAGLRLGFAIAPTEVIEKLQAEFGPWAVSGPALAVGHKALADLEWQQKTRAFLEKQSGNLRNVLLEANLGLAGGTDLFQLAEAENAQEIYGALLAAKIYVRRFDYNDRWLRFGLPTNDDELKRLSVAFKL